eukprot:11063481-Heterocapsa_arctica.AAC.1
MRSVRQRCRNDGSDALHVVLEARQTNLAVERLREQVDHGQGLGLQRIGHGDVLRLACAGS